MSAVPEIDSRFRLREPLRCDGAGALHCAEDLATGSRVAVRWLPLEANAEAALRAIQALPEHPKLPAIRATGRSQSAAYVAMDFPEGRLLSGALDGPMDVARIAQMGADVASALATLHRMGIFHGELSPESILLVGEAAYLWDVPLILANRYTDRRGESRMLAQLRQTAMYLAPERARGRGRSAAADVYALGTILCMAGGAARPSTESTLELLHHISSGAFRPLPPSHFPERLRSIVHRMVSVDPRRRPSALEANQALARAWNTSRDDLPVIELRPEMAIEPLTDPGAATRAPADDGLLDAPLLLAAVEPSNAQDGEALGGQRAATPEQNALSLPEESFAGLLESIAESAVGKAHDAAAPPRPQPSTLFGRGRGVEFGRAFDVGPTSSLRSAGESFEPELASPLPSAPGPEPTSSLEDRAAIGASEGPTAAPGTGEKSDAPMALDDGSPGNASVRPDSGPMLEHAPSSPEPTVSLRSPAGNPGARSGSGPKRAIAPEECSAAEPTVSLRRRSGSKPTVTMDDAPPGDRPRARGGSGPKVQPNVEPAVPGIAGSPAIALQPPKNELHETATYRLPPELVAASSPDSEYLPTRSYAIDPELLERSLQSDGDPFDALVQARAATDRSAEADQEDTVALPLEALPGADAASSRLERITTDPSVRLSIAERWTAWIPRAIAWTSASNPRLLAVGGAALALLGLALWLAIVR